MDLEVATLHQTTYTYWEIFLEKFYKFNTQLHLLFIDFKQAYDSINGAYLYEVLKEFGIPFKLTHLINMTLEDTMCKFEILGRVSEPFKVGRGVGQWDSLSALAYCLISY